MPRKPSNPNITPVERAKATARAKKNRDKRKALGVKSKNESFSILRLYAEKIVADHLSSHPCVDCGFSDTRALEFDHVRGKKVDTISSLVPLIPSKYNLQDLMAEIAKCEIRCSNCHTIRHKQNNYKV